MEENDPLLRETGLHNSLENQNEPTNETLSNTNSLENENVPIGSEPHSNTNPEQHKGSCRICLEDDIRSNLEEPCACKSLIHHACLQRWINERDQTGESALVCEICKQRYSGEYTVPPPRPPQRNTNDRVVVLLIDPETGIPRPILANGNTIEDDDYEEYQERMRPATACCVTFILFSFCSLLLTHLFNLPETPPTGGEIPEMSPDDAQFEDVSATLLLLWLMMRLIVIVAPVYTLNQFLIGRYRQAVMRRRRIDTGQEMQIVVHNPPEGNSGGQSSSSPSA